MKVHEYKTPDTNTSVNWRTRCRIYVPVFGLLHILGSIGGIVYASMHWDDGPDPTIYAIFYIFEFPASVLVTPHGPPQPFLNAVANAIFFTLLNAIFWGLAIVAIWHASSIILSQLSQKFRLGKQES